MLKTEHTYSKDASDASRNFAFLLKIFNNIILVTCNANFDSCFISMQYIVLGLDPGGDSLDIDYFDNESNNFRVAAAVSEFGPSECYSMY